MARSKTSYWKSILLSQSQSSIQFISRRPSPAHTWGVFICSGFLFLAYWRISQDNSSDKYPAGYKHRGAGGRRKSKLWGLLRSGCFLIRKPNKWHTCASKCWRKFKWLATKVNGKVKIQKGCVEKLSALAFLLWHSKWRGENFVVFFKSPIHTTTVTPHWSQTFLALVPEQSVFVSVMKPPLSPDK